MRAVSKEEFFAAVGKGDVNPIPGPERSVWAERYTRRVVGYTYPGWLCTNVLGRYETKKTYFLTEEES